MPTTMTDAETALNNLARRAGQLYTLPAVALEVLQLTQQPQIDIRALKECLEHDPALVSKTLRVVNSALYGLSREVSDLTQALSLLGIKPLKMLVLGFTLSDAIFSKVTGKFIGRYWRHTLTKAAAARQLSETLWHLPGDEPFLVALLQDLGMLVLLQDVGEPFAQFLDRTWSSDHDLLRLERQAFGFDHRELSSRLLHGWGLPDSLAYGVLAGSEGHEPAGDLPAQRALPEVLRLAELIAGLLVEERPTALARLLAAESPFQLSNKQLNGLLDGLQVKVDALADAFSMQLPEGLDYRDVLARAHAQLLNIAEDVVRDLIVPGHAPLRGETETEESLVDELQQLAAAMAARSVSEAADSRPHPAPRIAAAGRSDVTADVAAITAVAIKGHVDNSIDNDPNLTNWLATAVAACRQSRLPLSVALVELDHLVRLERELGAPRSPNWSNGWEKPADRWTLRRWSACRFARPVSRSCCRVGIATRRPSFRTCCSRVAISCTRKQTGI